MKHFDRCNASVRFSKFNVTGLFLAFAFFFFFNFWKIVSLISLALIQTLGFASSGLERVDSSCKGLYPTHCLHLGTCEEKGTIQQTIQSSTD